MNLLLDIGKDATDQKVEEIIRAKLARKEKIPGFGHRVYRTEDPRATHLRKMSEKLCQKTGNLRWFEMSQKARTGGQGAEAVERQRRFLLARRPTTRSAFRSICSRAVFAVSRMSGGPLMCSSSTPTTV
jgi:citrate synthase